MSDSKQKEALPSWDDTHDVLPSWDDTHEVARSVSSKSQDISIPESIARGAVLGGTFGAAPALTGAAEALPTALEAITGPKTIKDVIDAYNKGREESKAAYEAAEKANPKSFFAGNLAGGIAPAVLTAGATSALTGLQGARLAAAAGAGMGGLSGAGHALSEGEDLGQGLAETALGAAGGAVLGAGGHKLADATKMLPKMLQGPATGALTGGTLGAGLGAAGAQEGQETEAALRGAGIGATLGASIPLAAKSLSGIGSLLGKTKTGGTMAHAFEMGQEGQNIITEKGRNVVGQKADELAQEFVGKGGILRKALKEKGSAIGEALDQDPSKLIEINEKGLLNKLESHINSLDERDPSQKADKAKLIKILNNYTGKMKEESVPEVAPKISGARDISFVPEEIIPSEKLPDQVFLSPRDLQSFKSAMSNLSVFKDDSLKSTQGSNAVSGIAKELGGFAEQEIPGLDVANQGYGNLANAIKRLKVNPEKADVEKQVQNLGDIIYRLKDTNKTGDRARRRFDRSMELMNKAEPEIAKQLQERSMKTAKDIETAREATAESIDSRSLFKSVKGLTTKSSNLAGLTASKVSNAMSSVNNRLTKAPKEAVVNFGQTLMSKPDATSQKLGSILMKSADRDDVGRNALIYSLMQNPGYRELLRSYLGDSTEEGKK
jgi:hypothetical protein